MRLGRSCHAVWVGFILAGCSGLFRPAAPAEGPTAPTTGPAARGWSLDPWRTVVKRFGHGADVNYEALAASPSALEAFLASLADHGPGVTPELFPDREARLAYWVNAYNAVAVETGLRRSASGGPSWLKGLFSPSVRAVVDGRRMTLSDLADRARSASGADPRVELALRAPEKGWGGLALAVFEPTGAEAQLVERARDAMGDPALVKIDHERLTLWLGRPIWRVRARWVEVYRRRFGTTEGTILDALSADAEALARRRLQTAVGYAIRELPYDGSLNEWRQPKCSLD